MKNKSLIKAKKIFLECAGNKYQMIRDNKYEEYKSYNITQAKELEWIIEYQNDLLKKISETSNNFKLSSLIIDLLQTIKEYKNIEIINSLLSILNIKINNDILDSFVRMIIAEQFLKLVQTLKKYTRNKCLKTIKKYAFDELNRIINSPIVISTEIQEIDYLKSEIKDKNIRKRTKKNLDEWT